MGLETPRRVTWVRTGALGDLLVGLASLQEALWKWPNHQFTVIGSPLWTEVLEPGFFPTIDRILAIDRKSTKGTLYLLDSKSASNPKWIKSEAGTLTEEMKNSAVTFNARVDSVRQGLPALFARTTERWGSAPGLLNLIYTHRAPHDGKDPLIHERDVPLLLMDEAESGKPLALTLAERIERSPRIARWRREGLPVTGSCKAEKKNSRLLINPTSSRIEKAWPKDRFAQLIASHRFQRLLSERSLTLALVGAPNERKWLEDIADQAKTQVPIITPNSISELSREVSQSKAVLANTSSVQFLAASCKTPVATLMGRARKEIWGPVGANDLVIQSATASQFQRPLKGQDIFELELEAYAEVAVEQVLAALETWNALR